MEAFLHFIVRVLSLQELSQNATLDATLSTVHDASWNLTPDSLSCKRYHNVPTFTLPMAATKIKDVTQICSVPETALCKDGEAC